MNILDYVLVVVIAVLFLSALIYIFRQKKKGKSLCCGSCGECSMAGKCHKK